MKQLDRSKELPNDGLIVQAWIQMGCERREVTFLVTKAELELVKDNPSLSLESYIEGPVLDWVHCRFGWGWKTSGHHNDFSFMEDGESGYCDVNDVLNPSTVYKLVPRGIDRWSESSGGCQPT